MATTMALDLAQSALNYRFWGPEQLRGPRFLRQSSSLAPCWSTLERHCCSEWAPAAAAHSRKPASATKRRQALSFVVGKNGGMRAETRIRAASGGRESDFLQRRMGGKRNSASQNANEADTSGSDGAIDVPKYFQCGSPAETSRQNSVTCSRRRIGLLAVPLVLIGARARAEEIEGQGAPSNASVPESGSIADSKAGKSPEAKDELLEGGDIKVSGGTPRTGRAELGPNFRRYRAEDFSIYVPRSYENVTELDDNPRSTLTMEQKAANRPYAARFTSPDQTEVITVVIRDASTLRLSFLQTKDISDLGSLDKAAQFLLPPGAKLLKSRVVTQEVDRGQELEKVVKSLPLDIDTKLNRNYYQYEFYARGQQVALTAAAQSGKIYVVGATVPTKKWKDLAKQMRTIAYSFELR